MNKTITVDTLQNVQSSTIKTVGFSSEKSKTFVEFKNGGLYQYDKTSKDDFDKLVKAESIGKHFASNFKNKFDYVKLDNTKLEVLNPLPNKKTVIGLAGVKTSGKSTVANIIKKHLKEVNESALADKLKNVSADVFLISRNYFDDQDKKEVPLEEPRILTVADILKIVEMFGATSKITPEIREKYHELAGMVLDTPRKIAQIVGTEILRLLGTDIHCENVKVFDSGVTIISDLRFPNEFDYFMNSKEVNFIPLYLQRQLAESQVTPQSHSSETSVFLFNKKCIQIDNNNSLESTESQVLQVLKDRGVL